MDFNQEHNDMSIEQNKLSKESEQAAPVPCVSDESAVPTVPAEKEQIAPAEPKSTTPMPSAVKAAAPTVSQSPEEKRKKHRLKTKKYWKKRRRRRARHRRFRRFLFFMLAFILGIVVAYGAVAGAVYFVVGGLTIDTLQKFGVAEGADQYLTENGDVDLTDTTLLDLVRDLQAVGGELGGYSLNTLMQHYGLVLPEEISKVLPGDLMDVPLDTLLSDTGNSVTQNLTVGYVLSFLPDSMLDPRIIEAISSRPLSMLTGGEFGKLLEGIKMGYFFGVAYDESGNVQYANPEVPTFQEVLAPLDLGVFVGALTSNGDLLAVFAEQLGEVDAGAFLKGITEGKLPEDMVDGKLVKDIILLNAETGRYEFSFPAFVKGLSFGNAMGYTLVDGKWYSAYTDNGDDADDVAVSGLLAALSGISLEDAINKQLDLVGVFADLYFGDLQEGYTRTEPIYAESEGDASAEIVGYTWLKNGEAISEMQNALANIAIADLFAGSINLEKILGDMLVGDAAGYVRGEITTPADPDDPASRPEYAFSKDGKALSALLNAFANVELAKVLNGSLDIKAIFSDLMVGDASGYERGEIITPADPDDPASRPEYAFSKNGNALSKVQNAIANIALSDLLNGSFEWQTLTKDLLVGDAAGYQRGDVITPADPADPTSRPTYAFSKAGATPDAPRVEISGAMLEISNLPLSDLLNGTADLTGTVADMTVAELLEFTYHDGKYYSTFSDDGDPTNDVKVTGVLAAIADKRFNELKAQTLNAIKIGELLGYTFTDTDEDGEGDTWLDDDGKSASGLIARMADHTIEAFSSGDELMSTLRAIPLFELLGYEKVGNKYYSVYDAEHPENNKQVTGILAVLAEKRFDEMNSQTIDRIKVGELLGYTFTDTDGDGEPDVWLDAQSKPVNGVLASMADSSISIFSDGDALLQKMHSLPLAELLDYEKHGDKYYSTYDPENPENNVAVEGILAALADKPIEQINSDTIFALSLGVALGYEERADGWYKTGASGVDEKAQGILSALLDKSIGSVNSDMLNNMYVGEAMGFVRVGTVWYQADGVTLVTGIPLAIADLTIGELDDPDAMSNAIHTVSLGTALGYTKTSEGWFTQPEDPAQEPSRVTGMIATLSDYKIGELESKLMELELGYVLGYEKVGSTWYATYDPTDPASGKASGITLALADTKLDNLSGALSDLTIDNVLPQRTGVLALLDGNTKLSSLNSACQTAFLGATMGDLVEKGVITLSEQNQQKLNTLFAFSGKNWRTMTLNNFFAELLNALP